MPLPNRRDIFATVASAAAMPLFANQKTSNPIVVENQKTGTLDCYHQPMLHFEMYSGKASGSLGGNGGPYQRRSDLVNPTSWLKQRLSKKPP